MCAARCLTHAGDDLPVIHDWHVRAPERNSAGPGRAGVSQQSRAGPFCACKALTAGHGEAQVFGRAWCGAPLSARDEM
jgi:hypothetical protein